MNMPQLRFKEFTYQWEERVLGDIFTFKNGVNASKEQYGSGFRFINVLDIINNNFITYENIIGSVDITDEEFTKNEVKYGDVLFQRSSETREEVGQSNVYIGHQSVTFGGFVIRGRGIAEYDPIFFNYILKTDSVRDEITQRSGGSTRYNIGQDALNVIPILLPKIHEQTKIANFLTAIDEKITQLTQKYDLLKQYKKGVMQQIFNQKLGFKDEDGREFPEWEEKSFGEIADIQRGASPRPITDKRWFSNKSNIGWVRISDVTKSSKYLNVTDQYLSSEGIEKSRYVPKGHIIMSICATIGKPIYTNLDVCIHDGFVVFKNFKANHEFFYYYLQLTEDKWYQYGQPGSQVNLNTAIVSNETIFLPCAKEQTKIANFLTAIDDKITHTKTQLDAVKLYKKGLLQQMFV